MNRNLSDERLQKFIQELEKTKKERTLIIVEGKKDVASLNLLGLTNVCEIKGPLFSFCERIAEILSGSNSNRVVLLTDLDAEGKKLYGKLSRNLAAIGIKVDDSLREAIFSLPVSHIEGLASFVKNRMPVSPD